MDCDSLGITLCVYCLARAKSNRPLRKGDCWVSIYHKDLELRRCPEQVKNYIMTYVLTDLDTESLYHFRYVVENYYPQYKDLMEKILVLL